MKIKSFYTTSPIGYRFSEEKTQKVVAKLRSMKRDANNSYSFFNKYITNENNLSECDYNIENFPKRAL